MPVDTDNGKNKVEGTEVHLAIQSVTVENLIELHRTV